MCVCVLGGGMGGGAEQSKSPTPMHAKATTPKRTRKLKFVFTTIEPGLVQGINHYGVCDFWLVLMLHLVLAILINTDTEY